MSNKRLFLYVFWLLGGVVLLGLGIAGVVEEFWSGMGGGFVAISLLRILQFVRLKKDTDYRERVETENADERNRFLRNKAWAWAGYLFVILAAVASIVLKLLHHDLLSRAAGLSVCALVLLYWISFCVLRKKY